MQQARKRAPSASQKFWDAANTVAHGLVRKEEFSQRPTSQASRTRPKSTSQQATNPADSGSEYAYDYQQQREALEEGLRANKQTQPFKFLSNVGGKTFKSEDDKQSIKPKADNYQLKCRNPVPDIETRAISAMNSVHIDKPIDHKLYRFGAKSASTKEIEQKIKSHNYIMSLKRGSEIDPKARFLEKYGPPKPNSHDRPYTASTLLNDKPQFRITTPNLLSAGGTGNKQSLGDLLSDDQYRNELKKLEIVEDNSEDGNELDRFVSGYSDFPKRPISRYSAMVNSKRPLTSAIPPSHQGHRSTGVMVRPMSTLSLRRPISGHSNVPVERFFTQYNKEVLNIGDDIPFEDLFDRNERTICATFARFGDLSYHTPNYRIGAYMQNSAKLKQRHLLEVIALQNTVTSIEKNEFEIPIQLAVIDPKNPGQKRLKTGVSSVFKKEEVEREPITVSLFPEYFEDADTEGAVDEQEPNKEALKFLEKHLSKMGGHYDPETIGQDDYQYFALTTLPREFQDMIRLSYRRLEKFLADQNFIKNEEIARFKKSWISHAIARVPEKLLSKDDEEVRSIFQEVFHDYRQAIKRAILNYLLLSSEERRRLSIPLLLRESPPSSERVVRSGGYSILLYHDWHSYVENGRNFLQNNLYNMNIVNSSLVTWYEDFKGIELVETDIIKHMAVLGKSMSAFTFIKIQRNYRERVQSFMRHVWYKGAILILKRFKYIRLHKEKKGQWNLLGFSRELLDLKGFLKTSIESISTKKGNDQEDTAEAAFNVINTRLNESVANLLDVPLSKWGAIGFEDLLDIRDCPSYEYYSLYNKEPVLLSENGYKLLSPEVRTRLRASVGTLLALQLRQKVDASLKIFEDLVMKLPLFSQFSSKEELSKSAREDSFVGAPSISDRNTNTLQDLASAHLESKRSEQPLPSSNNLGATSKARLPSASKDLMFRHNDGLDPAFIKAKSGRIVGPDLEFTEIKAAVEPPDVFFLAFRFASPSFLKHQGNFQPFLQLEMLMENEIIKFGDTEDILRTYFSKMHTEMVELFKYFSHPEFISVHVKDDPIETHPKESYPLDNNHEAFYKRFMPYLELKEKKRKRKVQSILESAQVEDVDEKTKYLPVNETSEAQYLESCKMIADRVLQHYNEAKVSFQLLNQFKLVQDKTIENSVKSFLKRNHIALEDFRKNLLIVRAYQELLKEVPDDVYFPLFRVRTIEVKQHFSQVLFELEKALEERVKNYLAEEMQKIKMDFQRLKDTMNKPIENAAQYQIMDNFMTSLTQDRIQLRNRSHDMYKKILFCSKLFVTDGELLMRAKEIYDCPSQLESNVTIASIKHAEFKRKLLQDLEFRVERYTATLKEVNAGLADLQAVNNFDYFHNNMINVQKLDAKTSSLESERKEIMDQEVKLKGKVTSEYKDVLEMRKRLTPLQQLWEAVSAFMEVRNDIYNRRVFEVSMSEIDDAVSNAQRALTGLKVSFAKSKEEMKIVDHLDKRIDHLKEDYATIAVVCNRGLCERHWDQIKESVNNMTFNYKEDRLSDLLENPDILKNMEPITVISKQASVEYKLLQMLQKIETDWKDKRFELVAWKNSDVLIFAGACYEDIQMLLDDHVLRIQTILSDPGVRFMEALAKEWEERLEFMQETCEVWVKVQQAYIYLVPVFNSEDIRTHLAKSALEFKKVQATWEDLMHCVNESPGATSIQNIPQLLPRLRDSLSIMEHNLKELDEYLDMKRTKFSRFFFLSNEEMLSILSETKDPQLVQPHLKKCFEGINRLAFTIENDITGMLSEMGETIDFETKIIPRNYKSAVEEWLVKIEEQMKISLRSKVEEALIDLGQYKGSRSSWIRKWPGQAVLACSQVSWTMLVEDRLKLIKQMKDLKDELTAQLEEIVKMIRGDLSAIERTTLNALITLEVHNLDIVSDLITQRCNNPQDFDWLSQLRYYIHADKPMTVEMVMTKIDYGFEYLGNTPRLVITPLTDRCYRTLMSALFLNLGGAPEGPAGTGKTETTKDLAKAVAIQCVVHNCTGAMNSGAMAKFFKGLVSSGAWSCFDEFNRIQVEVLSVIAQQIHQIQTAKAQKLKEFKFDGTMLKIKDSCNIFITMNPGYAGRSELPDNLKSLFRPVAMMVPDYATIAEISLYSTGFIDARKLSKKIVATYKLCSEQLSSQYHYDYGMRTVKSVLVTAAMLKRRMRGATEDDIILQSIKDVNLPKFVDQDLDIFKSILMDLFPLSTLQEKDNPRVDEVLMRLMKANKLSPTTNMKTKIFQLNEMIKTRHGLMLVGDALSGKSTVYKLLAQTLNSLNAEGDDELSVNHIVINPKAVSINQIYGFSDPISQEWTEGILSHAFKQASKRNKTREWLVLDGPVDADWIENMNTVLDDNKCLCLMSSDKIPMSKYMTMIFETENLAKASPATVSRCGMIYLNFDLVGLRNYYHKWVLLTFESIFDADIRDHLLDLFDIILRQSVRLIESSRKQYQYISEMSLLSSFLSYFKMLASEAGLLTVKIPEEDLPKMRHRLSMLFVQAVAWSFGMSTLSSFRKDFDKFLRRLVAESVKSEIKPDRIVKFEKDVVPPEFQGSLMVDYNLNYDNWTWVSTKDKLSNFDAQNLADTFKTYHEICIETEETIRIRQVLKLTNKYQIPLLLVGATGVGKTQIVASELGLCKQEEFLVVKMNFGARTSSDGIQSNLMSKIDKKKRGSYGPKGVGQKGIWFIDDLNLPTPDEYGFQPPLELLRQYIEFGGWYDMQELKMISIVDFSLICAMAPPGGSKSMVPNRLLRHFLTYSAAENNSSTLIRIFSKIANWIGLKKRLNEEAQRVLGFAVEASIELYQNISEKFKPTPLKPHYLFNLRDISRVFQGMNLVFTKEYNKGALKINRMWIHETFRVMADRFTNSKDREAFYLAMKGVMGLKLRAQIEPTLSEILPKGTIFIDSYTLMDKIIFSDIMGEAIDINDREYTEQPDLGLLRKKVEMELEEYNVSRKESMSIIIFDFAVTQILKICRILRLDKSHGVLIGLGGSGRQTLTKLSSYIMGQQPVSLEVHKGYNQDKWRTDIKKILVDACLGTKCSTLIVTESQSDNIHVMQDIDSMLNLGEIPNLFEQEEFVKHLDRLKSKAKREGEERLAVGGSISEYLRYFNRKCQENLHVMLLLSSVSTQLRKKIRAYPSIVNCATICNFEQWPDSALEKVGLSEVGELMIGKNEEANLVKSFIYIHKSVLELSQAYLREEKRQVFITPSFFIDLIQNMKGLYSKTKGKMEKKSQMFTNGVDKIIETQRFIDTMKDSLEKKKPELEAMNVELAAMQVKLDAMEEEVRPIYEKVKSEEELVNKEFQKADQLRHDCEEELKVVNAIFEEAKEAVKTITVQDLFAVKSYPQPPKEVRMVMASMCIIFNRKPETDKSGAVDYWPASKALLNEGMKLLGKLNNISEKELTLKAMTKVRTEYISQTKFNPEALKGISLPASAFCKWVLAADKMEDAYRKVLPKRESMKQAEEVARKMKEELEVKQIELRTYTEKRDELQRQKEQNERQKKDLELEIQLTELRYQRAVILIEALSEEKVSWEEKLDVMKTKLPLMLGDCLLSAGVLVYLGAFSGAYRNKEIEKWLTSLVTQKIIFSDKFSLEDCIGDAMEIRKWTIKGLPNDAISREKGLTVYRTTKVPLIIDPQGQASKWVKSVEKDRNLIVTRLDKDDFLRQLEVSLRMGYPLLIESVPEDIDPVIYPVIAKQTFKDVTSGTLIKIGEEVISYHPNFRCILASKFTNPAFSAEVTCKACVINFMITREGLEDQLLELTVSKERLDLEESRVRIIEQNHQNTIKMAEIETEILSTLQNVEGNILDDEEAIKTLKMSNELSLKIKERQKNAAASEKQNEEARKVYRKLAHHGMLLYFAVQSLARINKTYEYSLVWFSKMYVRALEVAEKSNFVEQRIESVSEQINSLVYSNVCRGLYEQDKLIFGLILSTTLLRKEKKLNEKQFSHMLSPYELTKFKDEASPIEWLPDGLWRRAKASESLEGVFSALSSRLTTHSDIWETFFTHPKPDEMELPEPFENVTDLERLVLLRALRPETLSRGLKKFVANSLGKDFVRSPGFDLDVSYSESTYAIPLVFLLPGITPLVALEAFAQKMKKDDLRKISLGQGQAKAAEREIEEAKVTGNWVILENCHLYPSWMARLGQICEDLSDPAAEAKINPAFRLWLTTYPCPEFPLTVLQNSVKMSNEPPAGLGPSMELSFRSPPLGDDQFLEGHPNAPQLKTLSFALCLFHSVVQERRQYGPLGWNIPYEFSAGDLRVSLLHLAEFTKGSANSLPYKALHYMLGECNYGGRVTDAQDRRLLLALLKESLTPRLFYAGHRFAELEDYEVPPVGNRESYLAFAANLPTEQPPELCGLHPNAVLSRAAHETDRLLNGLASALGGKSTDGVGSAAAGDEEEKLIGPFTELKNKIPQKFVEKMVVTKFPVDYDQSMNTVLQQEVARYNRLLERISSSLSQVIDGLKGDAVISEKIEEALDSITQKKVPKLWLEVSYPSTKPLASYIDDLCNRIAFLNKWVESEAPILFWLPGFYFPQSFLTAILQNYARKHKVAVDLLEFDFEFGPVLERNQVVNHASDIGMNSEEACLIYGLFFEGCGWDARERRLREPVGREITAEAPVIALKPTKNKKRDEKSEFCCPLYKTPERRGVLSTTGHSTNFVMGVDIYTDVEPNTWIKRGAALLCQLPE